MWSAPCCRRSSWWPGAGVNRRLASRPARRRLRVRRRGRPQASPPPRPSKGHRRRRLRRRGRQPRPLPQLQGRRSSSASMAGERGRRVAGSATVRTGTTRSAQLCAVSRWPRIRTGARGQIITWQTCRNVPIRTVSPSRPRTRMLPRWTSLKIRSSPSSPRSSRLPSQSPVKRRKSTCAKPTILPRHARSSSPRPRAFRGGRLGGREDVVVVVIVPIGFPPAFPWPPAARGSRA